MWVPAALGNSFLTALAAFREFGEMSKRSHRSSSKCKYFSVLRNYEVKIFKNQKPSLIKEVKV
jgi:hypothetical protein